MKLFTPLSAVALLLGSACAVAAPAKQTNRRPADCRDDRGVDRCDSAQHARVLALYGLEPIEKHLANGDHVRRAFYVDGYGRDLVAISFVRPRGGDPILLVHAPVAPGGKPLAPLTAAVPGAVWEALIERSEHFEQALAPTPPANGKSEDVVICMHSWVYTVEATELPRDGYREIGRVRRKTEDACDHGLAADYAGELARAAVPLLPSCALLDPTQHRGLPSVLRDCMMLSGDRLAAAEVMNRLYTFRQVEGPSDLALIRGVFDFDAELDWQGSHSRGSGKAAQSWAARMAEGGHVHLFYESFEGLSEDRVRFVGRLSRSSEGADGQSIHHSARVEQIWTRKGDGFSIERATVGPFEPERPASPPSS